VTDLSWATESLTAWHTDPIMDEGRHSHCWQITVFWPLEPWRDERSVRSSLRRILEVWEGRDLPPELWSSEALAKAILQAHGNADVCGIKVERPGIGGCGVGLW